jgi:hypothetical protein
VQELFGIRCLGRLPRMFMNHEPLYVSVTVIRRVMPVVGDQTFVLPLLIRVHVEAEHCNALHGTT